MPLTPGTCAIAENGTVTGTGLAKAMADALMASSSAAGKGANAGLQAWTNALAVAIVDHLVANAAITVTVAPTDAGLQRTPNPNDPATPTLGPTSDVVLNGALT